MIDIKALKDAGYSQPKLKAIFERAANPSKRGEKDELRGLIDVHMGRIDDGVRRSLRAARIYRAIDDAYQLPLNQTTASLVRGFINRHAGSSNAQSQIEAQELAKEVGLGHLVRPVVNAKGKYLDYNGNVVANLQNAAKKIDLPTFWEVLVPVVMTYVKVRQASLFEAINLHPFFRYEANVAGPTDRALAKVLNRRVEQCVTDTGVPMVVRQSILQALKYGMCINFPVSEWWRNTQTIDGKDRVLNEGIKMETPHPSRTFYDPNHAPYTLNLETGCSYAGYWVMRRYAEMAANKELWNTDKLSVGAQSWRTSSDYQWFSKFYPCQMAFPNFAGTSGVSDNDREKNAFKYSKVRDDVGVDQVVYFERIVPKDYGLYDYKYPVWHRFMYAGDRVCIHCQPWLYHPLVVDLYDNDAQADQPISLALETIPHQDHFGNILTQSMLTVKKNLIRILGVNSDAVPKDFLDRLVNNSENMVRGMEVFEYSGNALDRQGLRFDQLFSVAQMPQASVGEQIGMLNTMISFIERVLGFSPHELGVSASHQISAQEAQINTGASMTRRSLTASHVADAQAKRKLMHYEALLAHGDDDFLVEVANLEDGQLELLKKAGLEVEKVDGRPGAAVVKGKKAALRFTSLFSTREDSVRTQDAQVAQQMLAFLDRAASNQALAQMMGPDQVAKIYNTALQMMGLPEEMYLKIDGKNMPPNPQEVVALIQKVKEQSDQQLQAFGQQVEQAIGAVAQQQQKDGQNIGQLAQSHAQVGQVVGGLQQHAQQSDEATAAIAQQVGALSDKLSQFLLALAPQEPPAMGGA